MHVIITLRFQEVLRVHVVLNFILVYTRRLTLWGSFSRNGVDLEHSKADGRGAWPRDGLRGIGHHVWSHNRLPPRQPDLLVPLEERHAAR